MATSGPIRRHRVLGGVVNEHYPAALRSDELHVSTYGQGLARYRRRAVATVTARQYPHSRGEAGIGSGFGRN